VGRILGVSAITLQRPMAGYAVAVDIAYAVPDAIRVTWGHVGRGIAPQVGVERGGGTVRLVLLRNDVLSLSRLGNGEVHGIQ